MYTLDNGIALHAEAPETFQIPSQAVKRQIKIGDVVKLIFREEYVERMWVIVTSISQDETGTLHFKGTLDNDPYYLKTIQYQDIVEFHEDHIVGIA